MSWRLSEDEARRRGLLPDDDPSQQQGPSPEEQRKEEIHRLKADHLTAQTAAIYHRMLPRSDRPLQTVRGQFSQFPSRGLLSVLIFIAGFLLGFTFGLLFPH